MAMHEKQFNTIVRKSIDALGGQAYKISDAGGYAMGGRTIASTTDIYGVFKDGDEYKPIYIEGKFNTKPMAFNLKRIETHQAAWLDWYAKIPNAMVFVILGVHKERGDTRAYVFDWRDLSDFYHRGASLFQKVLDKLPYNEVKKEIFSFDNIIRLEDLLKAGQPTTANIFIDMFD